MLNDDRGCDAPCTCDSPNAGCGGNFAVYPQSGCMGTPAIIVANVCTDATFPVASMEYTPMATGACDATIRSPVGDATPFDTTTVCCKPL